MRLLDSYEGPSIKEVVESRQANVVSTRSPEEVLSDIEVERAFIVSSAFSLLRRRPARLPVETKPELLEHCSGLALKTVKIAIDDLALKDYQLSDISGQYSLSPQETN